MSIAATPSRWWALNDLPQRAICWRSQAVFEYVDPYIAWADGTRFAGTLLDPCPSNLPMLLRISIKGQVASAAGFDLAAQIPPLAAGLGSANRLYWRRAPDPQGATYFGTGPVPINRVLDLRPHPTSTSDLTIDLAGVLAVPRITGTDTQDTGITFAETLDASARPVIAVIDDGCPFANAAYRAGSTQVPSTRVQYIWDQSDSTLTKPWQFVRGFGYGREIDRARLTRVMTGCRDLSGAVDEDACYRALGMKDLVGATYTHGAHVMGLLAGSPNPVLPSGDPIQDDEPAGTAPIIFVQLPREVMQDTSGGALSRHVLDALRYIDLRATRKQAGKRIRLPVVVNLSVGAAGGPHDGSDLIDGAIEQFLEQREGLALVVAAGNARGRDMHLRSVANPGVPVTLQWLIQANDGTDSFLELWIPDEDDAGRPSKFTVQLIPPAGEPSPAVGSGMAHFLLAPGADPSKPAMAAIIYPRRSAVGLGSSRVLCALAPTVIVPGGSGSEERPLAAPGVWQVRVVNDGNDSVEFAAWIERDEPVFGGPGRQSVFDHDAQPFPTNEQTLGSMAHSEGAVVVGGYRWKPDQLLDPHSGQGPGRSGLGRSGPDLIAPSDESPELPGILSCGVHSEEFNRIGGTSVAAPIVARRLYNTWSRESESGRPMPSLPSRPAPDEIRAPVEPESRVGQGRVDLTG